MESGVTDQTENVFLESAYFDPVHIRKTAKRLGLKTDASFRYERGADPNITVYALKRAALLIKEVAGGTISSGITDIYPAPIENFKIAFSYTNCQRLIGKDIPHETIKNILLSLGIEITSEGGDALLLSVPPLKVDVQREADVVEEILRIYGYNNIELSGTLRSSLSYSPKPDPEKIQDLVAVLLSNNGFNEILTNSLSKGEYAEKKGSTEPVSILNPLSTDLDVMRQTLLYTGLETLAHNINHKNTDLKFFEFGKTYFKAGQKYIEEKHLALFLTGAQAEESWSGKNIPVSFFSLKSAVDAIASRSGISGLRSTASDDPVFSEAIQYHSGKRSFAVLGKLKKEVLKKTGIKQDVLFADLNWDTLLSLVKADQTIYKEVPKFPSVRRDLALLVDAQVQYEQLEQLAYQTEKNLLTQVNLFDIYEGDKIEKGKRSYAMSFTLLDEQATLTDKQIEKVMERLQKAFEEKIGASIRS
jgi:phenylalanyl-tRNA synthetase beta chain